MLKALRKEISEDFKQLKLDVDKDEFFHIMNELTTRSNLSISKKNLIYKHLKRYHKLCVKDYHLRFEKSYDKITKYLESGGKSDNELSEMLDFIDENLINDIYGLTAYKVYQALGTTEKKDKFYNGLKSIENNKYISADEISKRKDKYINSYYDNLKNKNNRKF